MKKVLFLIHDLGQGGAEKVLVNLVNHLDRNSFDISVTVLFGGGINEEFLAKDIHFHSVFKRMIPGNSKWMKIFTPSQLHKICVKEHYDIEVAYLEGPSVRVISGCQDKSTKLISWIHTKHMNENEYYSSFRNKKEALNCYNRFDFTAFVSQDVSKSFCKNLCFTKKCGVLYNTVESEKIKLLSTEKVPIDISEESTNLIAVGSLLPVKRYDRLLKITKRLKDCHYNIHTYLLGSGPLEAELKKYIYDNQLEEYVTLLGYDTNPYKYLAKCDLFVCSSKTEGFSTATTEALIVGTPVCTVDVSGMKEMLGENNEYGIVTENSEEALYQGIKRLIDSPKLLLHYRKKAQERGALFNTRNTVRKAEKLFSSINEE